MPVKPAQAITAVSYSRITCYEECPKKCALQNIEKIQDKRPSPAMDRGTAIHAMAQAYVSGKVPATDARDGERLAPYTKTIEAAAKGTLPAELATFKKEFAKVRKLGAALVEEEWAFDKNWINTSWFAMHGPTAAFMRVKVDMHYVAPVRKTSVLHIVDYKTGKVYPEKGKEQLELYGLAGLLMYPDVDVVESALWYIDAGEEAKHTFKRDQLPSLIKQWMQRAQPVLNDRRFAPRPSDKCRWCFYRKSNTPNNGTGRELCQHG